MGKFDSDIKKVYDFKVIVNSVVDRVLSISLDFAPSTKRIYLDLNSALSIMFQHDDIADEGLIQIISDKIESFISEHLDGGKSLYILYSVKPSKVHVSRYEGWCHERYARTSILKSDFLKKLLVSLQVFSETNKSIKIVNVQDCHPALAVLEIDRNNPSGAVVISKDPVFKCIQKPSIAIYNGKEWIDLASNIFSTELNVTLSNPYELSSYYFCIRGDARNEYKGLAGYGKVRAKEYVETNKMKLKVGVDHPLKEHVDKYLCLYDIEKMKEEAISLGVDLSRFAGL